MRRSELVLQAMRRAGAELGASPRLEELSSTIVDAARLAWPTLPLEEVAFCAYVGERAARTGDPLAALAAVHAADLFLAYACSTGNPQALALFERHHMSEIDRYLTRELGGGAEADEVKQALRARLFVGAPGGEPKIGEYTGRGPLGAWLRVAAIRTARSYGRRQRPHGQLDEGEARHRAGAGGVDPEVEYLKRRYATEFREAFQATISALPTKDRNVLRLYFFEGMTTTAIGTLLSVHGSTVTRWIARTRQQVLDETHRRLRERLDLQPAQLDSLYGLVASRLDVSIRAFLTDESR